MGDTIRVRTVGQLSLASDHRVCDGGTAAAAFLRFVADCVERPRQAVAELLSGAPARTHGPGAPGSLGSRGYRGCRIPAFLGRVTVRE